MKNNFQNTNCVITGGAGLIGSYLAEELVNLGSNVFIVDDLSKGKIKNLIRIIGKYTFINANLEYYDSIHLLPSKCDYFFHLASRAYGIGYSENNHFNILNHNELITNTIIKYLAICNPKGVLITSSSCVYPDDGPEKMVEGSTFQGEPELANYGYGWSKRILEKKIEIFKSNYSFPIAIVRPLNIYGERYNWQGEFSQAIPMIIKKVMEAKVLIDIWGSGLQRRNYLHAIDCAYIMTKLVSRGFDGVVNIGTEDTISLNELALLIIRKANLQLSIRNDLSKPEGRRVKSSDSSKLKLILGNDFKTKINLELGIDLMLGWYRETF